MDNQDRILAAADSAETLAADLKRAVTDLRETGNLDYAYARLYHLRTELGRVVATLGEGLPKKGCVK